MRRFVLQRAADFIDSWLEYRYNNLDLPGFTVAVRYKDQSILNKSYGYANLKNKEKLTPDHIFRIASHSKTFTATSVLQLQEKGRLRIDDYVSDHLAWLKDHSDKKWHTVTIRQLLSHSAGVVRDGLKADYWQLMAPFPDKEQLRKEILSCDLVIENNTKLKYSNYGYSLLGLLIEAVSGMSYEDYVKENIINPLELHGTGSNYDEDRLTQLVTPYTRDDFRLSRIPISKKIDTKSMASATGFYSTSADLCEYFSAQAIGSGKLLSDESKKEMQRIHWLAGEDGIRVGYGLGFQIKSMGERKMIGHGGGFPGTITMSWSDPKTGLVVVVLANSYAPSGVIAENIVKILDYFEKNVSNKSQVIKADRFAGRFISLGGISEIIPLTDKKLIEVSANTWSPLEGLTELSVIDSSRLKIAKTGNYASEGEEIVYRFGKNGRPTAIVYAGITHLPEKDYLRRVGKAKLIELPSVT